MSFLESLVLHLYYYDPSRGPVPIYRPHRDCPQHECYLHSHTMAPSTRELIYDAIYVKLSTSHTCCSGLVQFGRLALLVGVTGRSSVFLALFVLISLGFIGFLWLLVFLFFHKTTNILNIHALLKLCDFFLMADLCLKMWQHF